MKELTGNETSLLAEMAECRRHCTLIIKARLEAVFNSLKYPVISATLDRYFLPEFRKLIADECNLIGYMSEFQPVMFEKRQGCPVILDVTRSAWQQKMCDERLEKRKEAEATKLREYGKDLVAKKQKSMKLPKDFGRIEMEEEMLRQDTQRRMALWREENETFITTKDYVAMWIGVTLLVVFIGWKVIW